jgi:hypothetical protein
MRGGRRQLQQQFQRQRCPLGQTWLTLLNPQTLRVTAHTCSTAELDILPDVVCYARRMHVARARTQ